MSVKQWMDYTNAELFRAEEARQAGNEGRARVCARRAAGYIIEEYRRRKGIHFPSDSAYARIIYLAEEPGLSPQAQNILRHLALRIQPDHTLPIEADLLDEVNALAIELLGERLQRDRS